MSTSSALDVVDGCVVCVWKAQIRVNYCIHVSFDSRHRRPTSGSEMDFDLQHPRRVYSLGRVRTQKSEHILIIRGLCDRMSPEVARFLPCANF